MKKIIKSIKVPSHFKIRTDSSKKFDKCNFIHETIKYDVWQVSTSSFDLKCADNHIVFDKNYNEIFIKDIGKNSKIQTINGLESVIEIKKYNYKETMFDLEINSKDHRYYTNGILSHNTSLARILAKDHPTLYMNVSDESSVDVVRTKITDFCSTISVMDNRESIKIVILDEIDGASDQYYKALRGTIEKFEKTARFIATCNYINKLPDAIVSRFTGGISFDFISKTEEKEILVLFIKRVINMMKSLEIKISQEAAIEFVKRNFPDMRMIVGKIQSFYNKGIKEIKLEDIKTLNYVYDDIFKICLGAPNPMENYKFLISNYASKVDNVLSSLGNELPDYIKDNAPQKINLIAPIIIEVADHQSKRNNVIDPAILMLSCVYKIQLILNK